MKKNIIILTIILICFSCKENKQNNKIEQTASFINNQYGKYGDQLSDDELIKCSNKHLLFHPSIINLAIIIYLSYQKDV
ncbi:MAG: hypothetical protein LBJ63_06690 [Prevotellaceae bacterium]|jgi:hypothetical protein|nr:hypothetical protein [Prevotellaceae bacterium]